MKKDKLLLVKGAAGLGNRILCLLSAMLYARMTERRLIVDWSDPFYSDDGSNVFHSLFLSPLCTPTDKIPSTKSVRPEIWRGRLHESVRDMVVRYPSIIKPDPEIWQRLSVDVSKLDYQEELLVMWSYTEQIYLLRKHFNGSYEGLGKKSTKTILKELLKENLKLHPSIQESVNEFKRDRFNGKTVGIHIRYSDKKTRLSAIEKKLKTLLRQEPDMQIFLATDNVGICKMLQDEYPRVLSTKKWYPTPGVKMHFNYESPNRVGHGIEALIDMYLLAECDYLILDESSSFSYVVSLLAKTSDSNVFNVQLGSMLPPRLRRLIWLTYIRLMKRGIKILNGVYIPSTLLKTLKSLISLSKEQ